MKSVARFNAWAAQAGLHLTAKDVGVVIFATVTLLLTLVWAAGVTLLTVLAPITVGLLLSVQLHGVRRILDYQVRSHSHGLEHVTKQLSNEYRQVQSLLSLFFTLRIAHPLPPLRGWAVSPDFGVLVISNILHRQPLTILELGSGVSTLLLGYCVRQLGRGHVLSVDHLEDFAEESRRNIARHGLEDVVTIVHAPLRQIRLRGQEFLWYDPARLPIGPIDCLIVDGPPATTGELARYPAIPLLHSSLSDKAMILVDDGERDDEQEAIRRWLTEFPWLDAQYVALEKGAFVLHKVWRAEQARSVA